MEQIVNQNDLSTANDDESIFKILVTCTNIYIDKVQNHYHREHAKKTDLVEMMALIGLLLNIGVSHLRPRYLNYFWNNSKGWLQLMFGTDSCFFYVPYDLTM